MERGGGHRIIEAGRPPLGDRLGPEAVEREVNRLPERELAQIADVVIVLLPCRVEGLGLVGDLARAGYAVVATSVSGSARAAALDAGAVCFIEQAPDPAAVLAAIRHSAEGAHRE